MNPLVYLLKHNWRGVDVQTAETMAFVTLSLCELFRAYTVRSERISIFKLGVFSNKYMQYAVGLSILSADIGGQPAIPAADLQHTLPEPREWAVILSFSLVPAVAEEVFKAYLRWRDARKAG